MKPVADRLIENSYWDGTCLRWAGQRNHKGYGQISIKGRTMGAHRVAYTEWKGPIPEGLEIDHVAANGCRNRDCINPLHLEAVTHRENVLRMTGLITHCPAGHPYTPENTKLAGSRRFRNCRACRDLTTQCPCGGSYLAKHRSRHFATMRHMSWTEKHGDPS